ncbi:hypothetical protein HPB52_014361 [Rhipicephalus sanguineus]|uniref:Uncharacterized protein n=1 Tax=Rhipicephalus sanguineus TaxID=34632 RepID=A0A9D4Q0E3_RHISA|nr:hypothetical protein HPB52_014361 [Rhipicephalus sanguineus]
MAHEPNFRAARLPAEHRSDPPVRSLICLPCVGLGHRLTGLAFDLYHLESRRGRRSWAHFTLLFWVTENAAGWISMM